MEKFKNFLKSGLGLLCCSLALIVVLALVSALVNTKGFSVKVESVKADMDALYTEMYKEEAYKPARLGIGDKGDGMVNAKLSGYLYIPKGVSAENPAPCVCITHGYLNSKEYVQGYAIELARRGYVVFLYDMYDHGTSTWDTPAAFNFYVWSAYDAMNFAYSRDEVLKAADGTGIIGLTGHSMGGFSSEAAAAFDGLDALNGMKQKCVTELALGADFRYDAYLFGGLDTMLALFGDRSCGTVAAQFDEFFFDNSANAQGTVIKKDYLKDAVGKQFLEIAEDGENGKFYDSQAGGERVIYMVSQDHPYQTWSPETTEKVVDFFNHAFETQLSKHGLGNLESLGVKAKAGKQQVWWIKEVCTCLSLIALVAGFIASLGLLSTVPFFKVANTDSTLMLYNPAEQAQPSSEGEGELKVENKGSLKKTLSIVLLFVNIALGLYALVSLVDRGGTALANIQNWVHYGLLLVALLGIGAAIAYLVIKSKDENEKANVIFGRLAIGLITMALTLFVLKWVLNEGLTKIAGGTNEWFNAPSVNTIVYYAIASGLLGFVFTIISALVNPGEAGILEALGLKANLRQVGVAFVKAVLLTVVAFLFIFLIGIIFKSDFRVYTYAFKAQVSPETFGALIKYAPLFFIFYLVSGMAVAQSTRGKSGWKADVLAAILMCAPQALFLLYQYGVLYTTGTAPYPNFALNGILIQGLIPTLIIMAVIQRRDLTKTGNIWTGVFFNTLFITLITVGNTTLYSLG